MVSDFSDGLLLEIPSSCAGAGAQLVLVHQVLSHLPCRAPVLKAPGCSLRAPLGALGKQGCFGGTAE